MSRSPKPVREIIQSKSICLRRFIWQMIEKAGRKKYPELSVTKYAAQILEDSVTGDHTPTVAYIYDVEDHALLAIVSGTEKEVYAYWQTHCDVNSTLYTFTPDADFDGIRVVHLPLDEESL